MIPDNKISICVVGCGNWGRNHTRTLYEFGILCYITNYKNGIKEGKNEEFYTNGNFLIKRN